MHVTEHASLSLCLGGPSESAPLGLPAPMDPKRQSGQQGAGLLGLYTALMAVRRGNRDDPEILEVGFGASTRPCGSTPRSAAVKLGIPFDIAD